MVEHTMGPLAVLTRPRGKNESLALRLGARGIQAHTLPALAIEPLPPGPGLLPRPGDYDLIVFVSGHAVGIYFDLLARDGWAGPWPPGTLAATVGRASAAPLHENPFIPSENIVRPPCQAGQDSEALWQVLRQLSRPPKSALIVRGATGREWLREKLEGRGARVRLLPVYRREPEVWTGPQVEPLEAALRAGRRTVCLLTSAESVDAVRANILRAGLPSFWTQAIFVAIHERVAHYLQSTHEAAGGKAPVPVVQICSPDDDAIFQALVLAAAL